MKKTIIILLIFICSASQAMAEKFDFLGMLDKSPLISINRNNEGKFISITSITMIKAPIDTVWEAIVDINAYKSYIPRVLKAEIDHISDNGLTIQASFEIKVPLKNTRYTTIQKLDRPNNRINVTQIAGDLKDSWFSWELYPKGNQTLVVYSGRILNYSPFIEAMDDKQEQTISVGINISTILATVESIQARAEALEKNEVVIP